MADQISTALIVPALIVPDLIIPDLIIPDLIIPDLIILGWRERVALPQLGIRVLKAKLDTGARSSSLHVDTLEDFQRDGQTWLRFSMHVGRKQPIHVSCEAIAQDRRWVTDTGGRRTERWFIRTQVQLAGQCLDIDVNLTDRRHMLFPLLLGRCALSGHFAVNPALSYTRPHTPHAVSDPS